MRKYTKYLGITFLMINIILIFGRTGYTIEAKRFLKGLSFELGAGYDQLFWKWPAGSYNGEGGRYEYPGGSNNRTAFSISATIRALYNVRLKRNIYLISFLGYDRLGGKSDIKDNGYKDEYWWNCINLGSIFSVKPKHYEIGVGLKVNYIVKVIGRYYGGFDWPSDSERSWSKDNWSREFTKFSYDAGIRAGFGRGHFYYLAEAWLGLSNLVAGSGFADAGVRARENHFRVLLGYRL
jgi:hypothetical protein